MLRTKFLGIGLLSILLIFHSGCSLLNPSAETGKKETSSKKADSEKKETSVQLDKLPSELEDLKHLREGPGRYGADKYDLNKIRPALNKIPKNISADQLYERLLKLVAEDYRTMIHSMETFDTSIIDVAEGPEGIRKLKVPDSQEVNIMILLDSSGSMADKVKGGVKMDLAKKAVKNFSSNMPQGANVSLLVYGHKGSNAKADKETSCASMEEVYPLGPYKTKTFQNSLDRFHPTGWTPLAGAMKEAKEKLSSHVGSNVQNIVYVVSDGVETCDGDPVKAAEELNESNMEAVVNIIGFDVDNDGQKALQEVADAGGGNYQTVGSKVDLKEYFEGEYDRLYDQWGDWASDHYDKAKYVASVKYDRLDQMKSDLYRQAEEEKHYLYDATEYLEEERDFDYDLISDVQSQIFDRRDTIQSYSIDRRDELQDEVIDKRDSIQEQVMNKRDSEQDVLSD
ncbi:vWA domain-containing protein [Melghirimyces algeriensis]|uniref:D-amino-acid dehydrogenase/Ca-activated chloride channel family protein n=1 Tax=Melghirimyces algeriensis TaxID=910412 RepID=A0A521FE49_9BACL|nr:VWA domain-containing protein [Melghirimyces algeriensis]SMO94476.1 D-amino-acid dehydrogenase/Ca-activated chloride channel family protein [Melghirimyces algeriensis]